VETKVSKHCAPDRKGKTFVECPTCMDAFDAEFIKNHHTFPAGTKRKVTDVFVMEKRSNHLLPVEEETSFKQVRNLNASLAATTWSGDPEDPLFFVADLIDLVALDTVLDEVFEKSGAIATVLLHSDRSGMYSEGKYERIMRKAVAQTHRLYLKDMPKSTPGASPKPVQIWDPCGTPDKHAPPNDPKGRLFSIAAMVLMTFMYQARTARFDVQKGITFMAKRISCWDNSTDGHLHHLVCYLTGTGDYTQCGWIGDSPEKLVAQLFVDADFAGCPYTLKSSSGCHFDIEGPNSCFPISSGSSGHTATAQSSTSAETCSLATGIRSKGDPAITILSLILGKYHTLGDAACGGSTAYSKDIMFMDHNKLGYADGSGPGNDRIVAKAEGTLARWTPLIVIREDNQTCITTNVSGKNGLMKELERAFGVYVSWNCARLASGDYSIFYTRSHDMDADIYIPKASAMLVFSSDCCF